MRRFSVMLFAASASLSAFVGTQAVAADGKTYSGTICQYWTDNTNANFNKMVLSQFGWVGNSSDANRQLSVVCPSTRDSMRGGIERVFVRSTHFRCINVPQGGECPRNSECTLRITHLNGQENSVRFEETNKLIKRDDSGAAAAFLRADFTNTPVPDYTSSQDISQESNIVLFCRLAPTVRLSGIYVGEATGDKKMIRLS